MSRLKCFAKNAAASGLRMLQWPKPIVLQSQRAMRCDDLQYKQGILSSGARANSKPSLSPDHEVEKQALRGSFPD